MTGMFLSEDNLAVYIEQEDEDTDKPKFTLTVNAKVALKDYYDAVHTLCEVLKNFAASTKVLEEKIQDKTVFLDIIKQVQLPVVQVSIRTIEEMEKIEGKIYRELTLLQHLLNFRTINPNVNEHTRTMAVFMYYILYDQITGLQKAQTGLAIKFRCQMTLF